MEQSLYEFSKFMTLIRTVTDGDFEVIKLLQKRLNKANTSYVSSDNFRHTLTTTKEKIENDPVNKYVHIREFVVELKAFEEKSPKDERRVRHEPKPDPVHEEPQPSTSKDHKRRAKLQTTEIEHTRHETKEESSRESSGEETEPDIDPKTARHIRKLEKLLGKVSEEIEKLEAKELTLDQLEDEECTYIMLDRYKKKFVKIWQRLCSLRGRDGTTGRVIEQKFQYSGSKYPEINRMIEKFVNKFKAFPDYSDVHEIVDKCRIKYRLKLSKKMVDTLSKDIFTEVGNNLQERRQKDLIQNFGCQLTDHFRIMDDPALYDRELKAKLEQNRKQAKSNLEAVISKFAYKQEEEGDGTDDDDEDEEPAAKKNKTDDNENKEASPAPATEIEDDDDVDGEQHADINGSVEPHPEQKEDPEVSIISESEDGGPALSPIVPQSPHNSSHDLSSSLPDVFASHLLNSPGLTEAVTDTPMEQLPDTPSNKEELTSQVHRDMDVNESGQKETADKDTVDTDVPMNVLDDAGATGDLGEVKVAPEDIIAVQHVSKVNEEEEENPEARVCVLEDLKTLEKMASQDDVVVCVLDSSTEMKPEEVVDKPKVSSTSPLKSLAIQKPHSSPASNEQSLKVDQKQLEKLESLATKITERAKSPRKAVRTPPPETEAVCILDDSSDEEPAKVEVEDEKDEKARLPYHPSKKLRDIVEAAAQKTTEVKNEYLKSRQAKQAKLKKEQLAKKENMANDKEQAMQKIISDALMNVTRKRKRTDKTLTGSNDKKQKVADDDVAEVHMLSDSDEDIVVDKAHNRPFKSFSTEQPVSEEKGAEKTLSKSLPDNAKPKGLVDKVLIVEQRSKSPSSGNTSQTDSRASPSPVRSVVTSARSSPVAVNSPQRGSIPERNIPSPAKEPTRRVVRNLEAQFSGKDSNRVAQLTASPSKSKEETKKSDILVQCKSVETSRNSPSKSHKPLDPVPVYLQNTKTLIGYKSKAESTVSNGGPPVCSGKPKVSSTQGSSISSTQGSSGIRSDNPAKTAAVVSKQNGKKTAVDCIEISNRVDDDVSVVGCQEGTNIAIQSTFSLQRLNLNQLKDNVRKIANGLKSKKTSNTDDGRVVSISDDEDDGPLQQPQSVILLE